MPGGWEWDDVPDAAPYLGHATTLPGRVRAKKARRIGF